MQRLERLFQELLSTARANPAEAAKLLGPHRLRDIDPTEAAAWVALARTLMNLDEFVTRE
jgi:hypothetical protein